MSQLLRAKYPLFGNGFRTMCFCFSENLKYLKLKSKKVDQNLYFWWNTVYRSIEGLIASKFHLPANFGQDSSHIPNWPCLEFPTPCSVWHSYTSSMSLLKHFLSISLPSCKTGKTHFLRDSVFSSGDLARARQNLSSIYEGEMYHGSNLCYQYK